MEENTDNVKSIFVWGLGKNGQIGNGKLDNHSVPCKVINIPNPVQISVGGLCVFALSEDGRIFSWGSNKYNRLGYDGDVQTKPKQIPVKYKIKQISGGDWHGAALTEEGKVLTWGYGRNGGGLGRGTSTGENNNPAIISHLNNPIKFIACGHNITAMIDQDDHLWIAGSVGDNGKDGLPYKIPSFEDNRVTYVAVGFKHLLIISDGEVYAWGTSKDKALGLGAQTIASKPTKIPGLTGRNVIQVSCSVSEHHVHSAAVTASGQLFTWGSGYKGKLGHDNTDDYDVPTLVETIQHRISYVSCGGIHSGVITENQELFTFGCGSDGRLGHIEAEGHRYLYKEYTPRAVEAFQAKPVRSIDFSYYHSCALVDE